MRSRWLLVALAALAAMPVLAQYRLALPGYRYEFPRDHFNHPDFQTEWWYFTGNAHARDGHRFGFELTFFRQGVDRSSPASASPWALRDVYLAHFALSDLDGGRFVHDERVNRSGPGLAGVDADTGTIWNGNWSVVLDPRRAMRNPARPASGTPSRGLALDLRAVAERFGLRLSLTSTKPPVIHGANGVSQKAEGAGQASHYVSLTRLDATGEIERDGRTESVQGTAWMDHEFFTNQLGRNQRGWDWMGLQLDDGTELMVYRLRRTDGGADPFSAGTLVEKDGRSLHLRAADFTMTPGGETWTSPSTHARYPISWRLSVPSRGLDLEIRTPLASQELVGRLGLTPSYWEGAVTVSGTSGASKAAGVGYLEMTGYDKAVVIGQPQPPGGSQK